jgi:acyl carrier protein
MNGKLIFILKESIGTTETVNQETKLKDFSNWDSMNYMILITQIEKEFKIQLTGDEIADLQTVGCVNKLIELKT